ncbi:MAG: transglutaminase-like domain-containing protein [Bacteroidetes bacterium]|nr:transglutaminase-like domain-containing protein [Bacteroidota bacterium]
MMLKPANNTTLIALIKLLDDPDETAFNLVRNQILLLGSDAIGPLEKCLDNTFDSMVRDRIQPIIRKLHQDNLYVEFSNWLNIGSSDLLTGFILVTKTHFPSLDERDIVISIEQLKMDIWIELHENLTALENVKVLNHIVFDIHHFEGNKSDMALPENSYIHSLLETKKGSPLSLGMLFIILSQKLGLPVYGVNLPQHFILAYLSAPGIENPGADDVLFYINPFNNGAVFTRREIDLFIGQMKINPEKSFFAPCSNPEIIRRLIKNLIFSYNQSGEHEKIEDLETLLTAYE